MKACVLDDWQDMSVREIEKPSAGSGEAVIRVIYAGVCGSDVTVYSGKHPTATVPVVVGHEIIGIIEEINDGGDFKVGDRVTVNPLISCGVCHACKNGYGHVCRGLKLLGIHVNGGYAEFTKSSVKSLVKIPPELSDKIGALSEPFAVGAHVTDRSGIKPGDKALVIGGGPIGIIVALCAKEAGAEVILSEVNENRIAVSEKLGITCINPAKCDINSKIAELTNADGFDVVYEASGSKAGILLSTDACRIRGTIVPLSLSGAPVEFSLGKVSFKEMSVIGSRVYTPEHFVRGVDILTHLNSKINLETLISDILPLDEAASAIDMMISGKNNGKILIKCS
jgi:2-desacetyl-2-hydroxyethyl bacteriochlorophyllide A dehydrogenase